MKLKFATGIVVAVLLSLACALFQPKEEELPTNNVIQTAFAQTLTAQPLPTSTETQTPVPTDTAVPTSTDTPTPTPTDTPEAAGAAGSSSGAGADASSGSTSDADCPPEQVAAWSLAVTPAIEGLLADLNAVNANPALLTDPLQGPLFVARAAANLATISATTPPTCLQPAQALLISAAGQYLGAIQAAASGDTQAAAAGVAAALITLNQALNLISQVTGG